MTTADENACSYLSLANPLGRSQGDLPRLLRRLATQVAALGSDAMILDLTLEQEITADGPWFSATVYYVPGSWTDRQEPAA